MGSRGFISDSVNYHLGEVKREESRAKITRKLLNLSQSEVCQAVGITRHLLSDVENGRTRNLHYDQALKLFRFYRDYFREHGSNSRGRFNALSVIRDGEDYVSFDFLCLQDLFAPLEKIARTSAQKESVPYKVVWIKDSVDGRVVLVAERDFPLFKEKVLAFKRWPCFAVFDFSSDYPYGSLSMYDSLLWDPLSPSEGSMLENGPSRGQNSSGGGR